MKLNLISVIAMLTVSVTAMGKTTKLDEQKIIELSKSTNIPQLDEIKSTMLESEFQTKQADDALGVEVYGSYNRSKTKEDALISLMPVYSPITQYQVGIKKNFKYGLQANLYSSVDQRSTENDTYKDLFTTTHALELNIDLWKDLFGRVTRRKLENAQLMSKQSQLQADINEKVFRVSLRRLYWSLVANNEKLNISKNLHKTAIKQAKDARRRKANSIADKSEVARYESQVAARDGSVLLLEYERENILKQLRSLLPELNDSEIELGKYSLNKTVFEVLECTALIDKMPSVPYEYTQYDELTKLLRTVQSNQESIDNSYDSIDLGLSATFKETGVSSNDDGDNTYSGSHSDAMENMKSGVSTGLMLTIPLGKKLSDTSDVKKQYNKLRLKASIANVDNNLVSTHKQISKSIKILGNVIKAQKVNSKQLSIRLKEMNKKYSQARIPVNALIQDQDALLSADLSVVDTQLAILNTLLDYFVVFSETPCTFNKK